MKILWMTWKDLEHPEAGGAEVLNEELAKKAVQDGHEVHFLVGSFPGAARETSRNGYKITRLGNRFTVYLYCFLHYKKYYQGWAHIVLDQMNTIPFFCSFYAKERVVLFSYQLCRTIWFYQMSFPLSLIGFLIEPIYLFSLRHMAVLTESESTRRDLQRYGFSPDRIYRFRVSINTEPVPDLKKIRKFENPTILSLGSLRPMKRTLHHIVAFEMAKEKISNLKLIVAGDGSGRYANRVKARISKSKFASDIEYTGRVSEDQKFRLMQSSHYILVTSVKEGWGLIVTEANAMGTPAIAYDVDGLRDSIKNNLSGILTSANNAKALSEKIIVGFQNSDEYARMQNNAWQDSFRYSSQLSYESFLQALTSAISKT